MSEETVELDVSVEAVSSTPCTFLWLTYLRIPNYRLGLVSNGRILVRVNSTSTGLDYFTSTPSSELGSWWRIALAGSLT